MTQCNETAFISFLRQAPLSMTMQSEPSLSFNIWEKVNTERKKPPLSYPNKRLKLYGTLNEDMES